MPSATMARAKRADKARKAEREASRRWGTEPTPAQRADAERAAAIAKVERDAAEHRRKATEITSHERAMCAARRALKGEGRPCLFIPADADHAAIGLAASAVVGGGPVDQLVSVLRPYAFSEVGYAEAVAAAADRRHGALLDTAKATSGGKAVAGKKRAALAADAERLAKAARAEAKRSRRGQVRRTTSKPRLFGPKWTEEEITKGIADWSVTVAMFETTAAGWRARRDPRMFGGAAPAPISAPEVAPIPQPTEEETPVLSDHPDFPTETPLTACRDQYAATMARHAAQPEEAPVAPVVATTVPTIPQALADYLARLVAPQKQAFAAAMVAHLYHGAPKPECDADWAPKAEAKIRRYAGKAK